MVVASVGETMEDKRDRVDMDFTTITDRMKVIGHRSQLIFEVIHKFWDEYNSYIIIKKQILMEKL